MNLQQSLNSEVATLATVLKESFEANADKVAISFSGDIKKSYRELEALVDAISSQLSLKKHVAILSSRSLTTYAGIVASVCSGAAYVPLNKRFPASRMKLILSQINCETIVVGEECSAHLEELAEELGDEIKKYKLICPEFGRELRALKDAMPSLNWTILPPVDDLIVQHKKDVTEFSASLNAYVLFTSGTTGTPKGIEVTHQNVLSYLRNIYHLFDIRSEDNAIQLADVSFDISVHDIFVTLCAGANLCIVPEDAVLAPAKYVKEFNITLWYSVPSVPMFMDNFRMLSESAFPTIRYSFFAGEALPHTTAQLWLNAAPNSALVNMYGPTEATVVVTAGLFDKLDDSYEFENGIVPIGNPYPDIEFLLLNDEHKEIPESDLTAGELYIAGPQVTKGYLNRPDLTESKFVKLDGYGERIWYRTGDLVKRGEYGYDFLGRIDDQIQLRGFRVELAEIDRSVRSAVGSDLAISVPIDLIGGRADSVIAVVQGEQDKALRKQVIAHCKASLPDYMVPSKVKFVEKLPLNINGKIDRKALMQLFG